MFKYGWITSLKGLNSSVCPPSTSASLSLRIISASIWKLSTINEAYVELYDEEEFQNAIALVTQQFNRLPPPTFHKNQQFTKPPFNWNFNPQKNHQRYARNPHHQPQPQNASQMISNHKEISQTNKSPDSSINTKDNKDGVLVCHKCHRENHFARDYKSNVVKVKAFYHRTTQEMENRRKKKQKYV